MRAARHAVTHGDGGGVLLVDVAGAGKKVIGVRSPLTAPMGLKIEDVAFPPQRMPASVPDVGSVLLGTVTMTGAPLSPPAEVLLKSVWHSTTKVVPDCGVSMHVAVTVPPVHPVVRPIFETTAPAMGGGARPVSASVAVTDVMLSVHGDVPTHSATGFATTPIAPL